MNVEQVPLDTAELTFVLFTLPTRRKIARRLVLEGKRRHLNVKHEHDGGWFSRYHLITASGDDRELARFSRAIDRWVRNIRTGRTGAERRAEMRRLFERVRATKDQG